MALILADRVRETTTTTGTGSVTLAGALTGFRPFSAAVGDGNTTYYVIAGQGTSEWEVGIGTYASAGNTLARTTVLASSNGGSLVNFSAGTKDVWVDYAAGKAVTTDTLAYPPAIGGTTPAAGTFTTLTATGQTSLGGAAGAEGLQVGVVSSSVNFWYAQGSVTGGGVQLRPSGGDTNIPALFSSKGNSQQSFYTNTFAQEQLRVSHTASAVNYVQVTGAATGNAVQLSAQGSNTNIPLVLQPKGTGALQAQQTDSTATGGNARGTNAVDWQTIRSAATMVASGVVSFIGGGQNNTSSSYGTVVAGGANSAATGANAFVGGGNANTTGGPYAAVVSGSFNSASGHFNFIGCGTSNSGTSTANVTTQSATMNGTTAVTLSASNASIKVGQYITGTSIVFNTYVAAISGTSLTLSQAASGSSTSTLSFFTPHGVVVGGGNNQATGSYSFIGGGGDAGTAANRNVASGPWSTVVGGAKNTASGEGSFVGGGNGNTASTAYAATFSGLNNSATGVVSVIAGGQGNVSNGNYSAIVGGVGSTSSSWFNFIGGGYQNNTNANAAVTTQSATMNGTTAVTLSSSNASIKVGQIITGTSIAGDTYVSAISGTSLTLSKVASGSSTSTLSFFTPHGVVVGGGNNQATGSYSFIGGGGDAGTAANRNVASGSWSTVGGGTKNVASGQGSVIAGGGFEFETNFGNTASGNSSSIGGGILNTASGVGTVVVGGWQNIANGPLSTVVGGRYGTTRSIEGSAVFPAHNNPIADVSGLSQAALLILGTQTTDATATVLRSNTSAAGTTNQVILPNNSAYFFTGEVVAGVTGGGNTKGWKIEGVIKRGANAASTTLVGSTVTSSFADAGASTWAIALSADTTNGGLAVTFTGQASTTIRTVAQIRTTEMTF